MIAKEVFQSHASGPFVFSQLDFFYYYHEKNRSFPFPVNGVAFRKLEL